MCCHVFLDVRSVVHPIFDGANDDHLVGVFAEGEDLQRPMNALRHAAPHAFMDFSYRCNELAP